MSRIDDRSGQSVYRCSDGRYVGEADLWERFESGRWKPFCWDQKTGREWVETTDKELLLLIPISRHALPEDRHIEIDADGARIRITK